jgi:hypothetical protein
MKRNVLPKTEKNGSYELRPHAPQGVKEKKKMDVHREVVGGVIDLENGPTGVRSGLVPTRKASNFERKLTAGRP